MTAKAQLVNMIDKVPAGEIPILMEIVSRFIPASDDEVFTEEDLKAHQEAIREFEAGETVSIYEIT